MQDDTLNTMTRSNIPSCIENDGSNQRHIYTIVVRLWLWMRHANLRFQPAL